MTTAILTNDVRLNLANDIETNTSEASLDELRVAYLINQHPSQSRSFGIVRKISVAFRSAKVACLNFFAERKTTVKNRKVLNCEMLCHAEPELSDANRKGTSRFADGIPVVWAARLKEQRINERAAGSDLVSSTCALAARRGASGKQTQNRSILCAGSTIAKAMYLA